MEKGLRDRLWREYRAAKELNEALERELRRHRAAFGSATEAAGRARAWIELSNTQTALERHTPLLESLYERAVESETERESPPSALD